MKRQDMWEPERIDILTELWSTGLSTAKIGDKMGITKNAVIGKARRLKLRSREVPGVRMRGGAPKKVTKKTPVKKKIKKEIQRRPKDRPLVPLADVGNGCLWPYGDPQEKDFGFCGEERAEDKSYCIEHHEKSVEKKKRNGKMTFKLKSLEKSI